MHNNILLLNINYVKLEVEVSCILYTNYFDFIVVEKYIILYVNKVFWQHLLEIYIKGGVVEVKYLLLHKHDLLEKF